MKKLDKKYKIAILVSVLVLLEQLSKVIILLIKEKLPITVINNAFMLSYVENSGMAFGIKVGTTLSFVIVNIIVLGIIIAIMRSQLSKLGNKAVAIFSLIIAGGLGNLIDRVARGYVIDFLDITPIVNFPVFNFADIMLVIGVIIFAVTVIKNIIKDGKKGKNNGDNNSTK